MYKTESGEQIFIVDGHIHLWDASPENQKNRYGRGFIDCFYAYHKNLSPKEYHWPLNKYEKYTVDDLLHDILEIGYVDVGIFQPTYLTDFYKNGFNTTEQNYVAYQASPKNFRLNGSFDPRDGEKGLEYLRELKDKYNIMGLKLYTAEWRGNSKGYRLNDSQTMRFLEECVKLGIKNIHPHKGPTIYPLNYDAFSVGDVDEAASTFTELNFIVEHAGVPRIEDFCWIATQESNVYAGLAVVLPFMYGRPRYFAEVMAELLFWVGPDKLLFGSDYALWQPKWLVESLLKFEMPEDLKAQYGVDLTMETKKKILGLNAARIYDIKVPELVKS
jgi:predicted TIM-barrel fold metal-dependent hydrolase